MELKRVVVTGIGTINPIGNNIEEFWSGIKEGKCGIDNITFFDTTDFNSSSDIFIYLSITFLRAFKSFVDKFNESANISVLNR